MSERGTIIGANPLARMRLDRPQPGNRKRLARVNRPARFADSNLARNRIGAGYRFNLFYQRIRSRFHFGEDRPLASGEMVYKLPRFWSPRVHVKLHSLLFPVLLLGLAASRSMPGMDRQTRASFTALTQAMYRSYPLHRDGIAPPHSQLLPFRWVIDRLLEWRRSASPVTLESLAWAPALDNPTPNHLRTALTYEVGIGKPAQGSPFSAYERTKKGMLEWAAHGLLPVEIFAWETLEALLSKGYPGTPIFQNLHERFSLLADRMRTVTKDGQGPSGRNLLWDNTDFRAPRQVYGLGSIAVWVGPSSHFLANASPLLRIVETKTLAAFPTTRRPSGFEGAKSPSATSGLLTQVPAEMPLYPSEPHGQNPRTIHEIRLRFAGTIGHAAPTFLRMLNPLFRHTTLPKWGGRVRNPITKTLGQTTRDGSMGETALTLWYANLLAAPFHFPSPAWRQSWRALWVDRPLLGPGPGFPSFPVVAERSFPRLDRVARMELVRTAFPIPAREWFPLENYGLERPATDTHSRASFPLPGSRTDRIRDPIPRSPVSDPPSLLGQPLPSAAQPSTHPQFQGEFFRLPNGSERSLHPLSLMAPRFQTKRAFLAGSLPLQEQQAARLYGLTPFPEHILPSVPRRGLSAWNRAWRLRTRMDEVQERQDVRGPTFLYPRMDLPMGSRFSRGPWKAFADHKSVFATQVTTVRVARPVGQAMGPWGNDVMESLLALSTDGSRRGNSIFYGRNSQGERTWPRQIQGLGNYPFPTQSSASRARVHLEKNFALSFGRTSNPRSTDARVALAFQGSVAFVFHSSPAGALSRYAARTWRANRFVSGLSSAWASRLISITGIEPGEPAQTLAPRGILSRRSVTRASRQLHSWRDTAFAKAIRALATEEPRQFGVGGQSNRTSNPSQVASPYPNRRREFLFSLGNSLFLASLLKHDPNPGPGGGDNRRENPYDRSAGKTSVSPVYSTPPHLVRTFENLTTRASLSRISGDSQIDWLTHGLSQEASGQPWFRHLALVWRDPVRRMDQVGSLAGQGPFPAGREDRVGGKSSHWAWLFNPAWSSPTFNAKFLHIANQTLQSPELPRWISPQKTATHGGRKKHLSPALNLENPHQFFRMPTFAQRPSLVFPLSAILMPPRRGHSVSGIQEEAVRTLARITREKSWAAASGTALFPRDRGNPPPTFMRHFPFWVSGANPTAFHVDVSSWRKKGQGLQTIAWLSAVGENLTRLVSRQGFRLLSVAGEMAARLSTERTFPWFSFPMRRVQPGTVKPARPGALLGPGFEAHPPPLIHETRSRSDSPPVTNNPRQRAVGHALPTPPRLPRPLGGFFSRAGLGFKLPSGLNGRDRPSRLAQRPDQNVTQSKEFPPPRNLNLVVQRPNPSGPGPKISQRPDQNVTQSKEFPPSRNLNLAVQRPDPSGPGPKISKILVGAGNRLLSRRIAHGNIRASFATWRAENHAHTLARRMPRPVIALKNSDLNINAPGLIHMTAGDAYSRLSMGNGLQTAPSAPKPEAQASNNRNPSPMSAPITGHAREDLVRLVQDQIHQHANRNPRAPLETLTNRELAQLCDALFPHLERRLVRERERRAF